MRSLYRCAALLAVSLSLAACGDTDDRTRPPDAGMPDLAARDDAKTPLDQSNADRDLEVTRQIRERIVDGDFSMDAQNVKVITERGTVTLRGPVETEAERHAIVAIARDTAGELRVDDQLEVARE